MEFVDSLGYSPANGAAYPNSGFTIGLKTIAQVAKADVGLEVAAISLGGMGYPRIARFALRRFVYQVGSLGGRRSARFTLTWGRAWRERPSSCIPNSVAVLHRTINQAMPERDHGYGGIMFVMGGGVNGGQVITDWPGIAEEDLVDGNLDVTIDSRGRAGGNSTKAGR